MPYTYCPNCESIINVNTPREGVMITCRKCEQQLEIISTDPFEVDFPLGYWDDDSNWDDDEDEEDEGEDEEDEE